MKKILYATDFSKNAEKAFHYALKIAEKHRTELIMLHVFDIPPIWGHPQTNYPIELTKEASKSWKRSLKELSEQFISEINPIGSLFEDRDIVSPIILW